MYLMICNGILNCTKTYKQLNRNQILSKIMKYILVKNLNFIGFFMKKILKLHFIRNM